MPRGNGGVLGPANIPTTSVAKGVWSLIEQQLAQRQGIWPTGSAPIVTDPYFDYTTLLLPGNGTNGAQNNTFLDGSTNNFTITRNGNTTQGTFSPFSQTGWGNYFDGNGDYLYVNPNSALDLQSGVFTIELWALRTTGSVAQTLITNYDSGSVGYTITINASNKLTVNLSGDAADITGTTDVPVNQWFHVALSGTPSSSVKLFLNGGQEGSTYTSTTDINSTRRTSIGAFWYYVDGTLLNLFTGYISNLRILKGTALYTSNFTPPTAPLTAISGTSLLTCQSNRFIDNSTNNFTITKNGDTRVVAFSPFNPTASWSAATYGGSGYFDGNGDYLYVDPDTALNLQGGAFTIEFWALRTTGSVAQTLITNYDSGSVGYIIAINASNKLTVNLSGDVADITGTTDVPVNQWFHVALSGTPSSSVKLFLNGGQEGSTYTSTTDINSTRRTSIGAFWYYVDGTLLNLFTGYISDLRILKGTALYTTTFTPPTAPLTAITNTSLLLNFTNAGIYDATSKNDLETVGNAQISTTQSKWGGSSISFDGTGDWLLIPDQPPQRIGTSNFTIEMWVYRNSSGTYGLAGKGTGTTGWLVSLNSSNQVVFTYGSSTITSSGTVSATTWTHIAVVREGTSTNQTKIYISGTNDGTGTVSTDFNQTNSMYIGADRTGGSAANAYVQDVRITNYARYTGNFTPPTAAFPTL